MTLLWLVPPGAYRGGEDENNEVLNEEPNLHAGSLGDALLKDASELAYAWRRSKDRSDEPMHRLANPKKKWLDRMGCR